MQPINNSSPKRSISRSLSSGNLGKMGKLFGKKTSKKVVWEKGENTTRANPDAGKERLALMAKQVRERLPSNWTEASTRLTDRVASRVKKPLSLSHREVFKQIKANEKSIQIAFEKARYNPEVLKIGEVLPSNQIGELKALGSGALHTAYRGTFQKTTASEPQDCIIKFEEPYTEETKPSLMNAAEIPLDQTCETARNVLAKALDDMLGWNVIIETEVGVLEHPVTKEPTVVTAMAVAKGIAGEGNTGRRELNAAELRNYNGVKKNYTDKEGVLDQQSFDAWLSEKGWKNLKEETNAEGQVVLTIDDLKWQADQIDPRDTNLKHLMIKLQLEDSVLLNADRHLGNYIIEQDDEKNVVGLKGIDNDQLCGNKIGYNDERFMGSLQRMSSIKKFPVDIPREICEDFLHKTSDTMRFGQHLKDCLPGSEVMVTLSRLAMVRRHVQKVLDIHDGKINNDLGKPNESNSYYMTFLAHNFPDIYEQELQQ